MPSFFPRRKGARLVPALVAVALRGPSLLAAPSEPLPPQEEAKRFHLPDGFVAELVADETVMHKAVAFNFDSAGRMWVTTAGEYPMDGNEQPERAAALYRDGGKDAVLVFDTPWAPGLQKPRVFAGDPDGNSGSPFKLAMPMGVLPYKDGAIIHHGTQILFLHDTKGTGMADSKEVLLDGFGTDDSHLMPHGFWRGPGDWIYIAQGAFNHSHVKTKEGPVINFQYCKVMRFKPDGSHFEVVGWGPCNDWGFVIDRRGRMWGQEANDYGFPMYPFEVGYAIPGIGDDHEKPYAPLMTPPKKRNDCTVGGTGLSGLAMSEDSATWPKPYTGAFILANPITNKLQAMLAHQTAPGWEGVQLEMLGDFLRSDDERFRPVAIQFGPDGCLYVNDWYNKIISHNEVPRNHPDRDKIHTRIWRIRWTGAAQRDIPNLRKESSEDLIGRLASANQWECNSARFELIDRLQDGRAGAAIIDKLQELVRDPSAPAEKRIAALWTLERANTELNESDAEQLLIRDPDPNIRRAAMLALGEMPLSKSAPDAGGNRAQLGNEARGEKNIDVIIARLETLRERRGSFASRPEQAQVRFASLCLLSVPGPRTDLGLDGAFARYLIRSNLEPFPDATKAWLEGAGQSEPIEARMLAALSLPAAEGAPRLAKLLPELKRPLIPDEAAVLASQINQDPVSAALTQLLANPETQSSTLTALSQIDPRTCNFPEALQHRIAEAARSLAKRESSSANNALLVKLARSHRLTDLEPDCADIALRGGASAPDQIEAMKALRELGSQRTGVFKKLIGVKAGDPMQTEELHRDALVALSSATGGDVLPAVVELWPQLPPVLRTIALDKLASSKTHAAELAKAAVARQGITTDDIDDVTLDKLVSVLGADDPSIQSILAANQTSLRPVLRLSGSNAERADTSINLQGPFTVETWIKLDEGISNNDVLLGSPDGGPSFNFFDGHLRVYIGHENIHDALVAKSAMRPDLWSHVAITRDEGGRFKIFIHGELDAEGGASYGGPLSKMDIGRSPMAKGTSASFTEFRVWDVARTAAEILDNYQRSFSGEPLPPHLIRCISGAEGWGTLDGGAHIQQTRDFPDLLTPAAAHALDAKFARFRSMIAQPGDAGHGHALFVATCAVCHRAKGEGAQIGPELSGAGAMGDESLLRNVLTPNLQIESGYYRFDVQLKSGDLISGFFVKEDSSSVVIRPIGADDRVIPRDQIARTKIARKSIMPEGLLDAMSPRDVADLFSFLRTLK